jgi:hypothetical protein
MGTFSDMKRAETTPQSMEDKVLKRVRWLGLGAVVTPGFFVRLGGRAAIDKALSRLVAAGRMRRVARGLYDIPRRSKGVGITWPSVESVVKAIARRDRVRVQPTGAYAANRLGLTTQVPMRVVFLTDGPTHEIPLGKLTVTFKRTTPRNMATAGRISGLVIQAMRWLGRKNVDDDVIRTLKGALDEDARQQLVTDLQYAPVWIADVMRRVALDER